MEMDFAKFLVFYGSEGCKVIWRFLKILFLGKLFIYKNPVKSIVAAVFNPPKNIFGKAEIPKSMHLGKHFLDLGKMVSILGK